MWNEKVLRHIISPIGKLIKMAHNSEDIIKGLFARVCVEVHISKPLKRTLKYVFTEFAMNVSWITKILLAVALVVGINPINLMLADLIPEILQ